MNDDPKYPQYRVDVKWPHPDGPWPESPWNRTGWHEMHREDPGEAEIRRRVIEEWWPKYVAEKNPLGDTSGEPIVEIKRLPDETWSLLWFCHYTFDIGQTDAEALASFERFVQRKEDLNRREGKMVDGHWRDVYCLMGAEDRWRWRGGPEQEKPPCRCEGCKKHGRLVISH